MSSSPGTLILRDRSGRKSPATALDRGTYPSLAQIEATTVSAPIGILTRLAGAKIEPLTVAVGRHMFGIYQLAEGWVAQMEQILSSLTAFPSFQAVLWFGFGVKHPIHILSDTAQGTTCVAMCAALGETHSEHGAARIIDRMAAKLWSEGDNRHYLRPSLNQWTQLVHSCQGLLVKTDFGLFAEELMRLADESDEPRVYYEDPEYLHDLGAVSIQRQRQKQGPFTRVVGDPAPTAEAMIALADVSTQKMANMVLIGGAECGFIVALALRFFDLSIQVRRLSTDQVLLERGMNGSATAQVTWLISSHEDDRPMSVVSRAYVISSGLDMFAQADWSTWNLSGRVTWESAIMQVFGLAAKRLFELPSCLGMALGLAARMFGTAAALPDGGSRSGIPNYMYYHDASHGLGFVNTATTWFPELGSIREKIDTAVSHPFRDAPQEFAQAMSQIATVCNCVVCGDSPLVNTDNFYNAIGVENFCLTMLAFVIIRLVQCVSRVQLHGKRDSIAPSRVGIETIYKRCRERGRLSDIGISIDTLILYAGHDDILNDLAVLFSGKIIENPLEHEHISAVEAGGFCVFRETLRNLSDDILTAEVLNVVPGHMIHGLQSYRTIKDYHQKGPTYPARKVDHNGLDSGTLSQSNPKIDVTLVANEGLGSLSVSYKLKTVSGEAWIGPNAFTHSLRHALRLHGAWSPSHQSCASKASFGDNVTIIEGEGLYEPDVLERRIRLVGNQSLARCIAVANHFNNVMLLDKTKCRACSINLALDLGEWRLDMRWGKDSGLELIC